MISTLMNAEFILGKLKIQLHFRSVYRTLFFKTRGILLVLFGCCDATHCLVLSCFVVYGTKKQFHTLMTVSNTGCNRYAQCLCGIFQMYSVRNLLKNTCILENNKSQTKQDQARPGKTRQDEVAPWQEGVPWFWKVLYIPDSKDHEANMGPTWALAAPVGPHVGPMNLAIRDSQQHGLAADALAPERAMVLT